MDLEKLKKLVNEMCDACAASGDKPDAKDSPKQAKMARTDLVTIARDAQELVNMFSDETDLPEWVESEITKAADYLNSVRKYIGGEIIRQQDNLMETKSTMPSGSGNPDWNGMSVGLLFGGKFVAIAPNGQALGVFDSREEVVKYIETHMSDYASVKEEYYHISDAIYDDGSPVEEEVEFWDDVIMEAEYKGRKVKLNKPMRGDVKKSKVYVKNKKGNVIKVNFGDKKMKIKKSNPKRRKSFRARHNCKNPGPKTKARYWSCKAW